ncbi:hypothetical protein [Pandoraea norimbergensis]|uniref:Stationary phase growth adaptation protein n=1 Tax=Pandoraea norimbergensis TaxID=93219 RepID=A0ABM5WIH5_9BURK|nr:hypothetical protein [Pandoraea norimbergensis]ALS59992.1 hypothetical protein AT302_09690 [Pandoraea norimbergensis]
MLLVETLATNHGQASAQPFGAVAFRGATWDLSHLAPFAFKMDVGQGLEVSVFVLFSCHCFTKSFRWDPRPSLMIPDHEIYVDEHERRVLCEQRYNLSRQFLREIVTNLESRRITLADDRRPNFVTLEHVDEASGQTLLYAVFFEVERDKSRKRLILRVQSAYVLEEGLTKRQRHAKKIALATLLRNVQKGKPVRA